jgi:hypothetical protein
MEIGESLAFNGRVILALLQDPQLEAYSGKTLISAELAQDYGIPDDNGRQPPSFRTLLGSPLAWNPIRII